MSRPHERMGRRTAAIFALTAGILAMKNLDIYPFTKQDMPNAACIAVLGTGDLNHEVLKRGSNMTEDGNDIISLGDGRATITLSRPSAFPVKMLGKFSVYLDTNTYTTDGVDPHTFSFVADDLPYLERYTISTYQGPEHTTDFSVSVVCGD